jgi:hypothetical protein
MVNEFSVQTEGRSTNANLGSEEENIVTAVCFS